MISDNKEQEVIEFTLDDGTTEKGYIIADAKIAGQSYILISDTKDASSDAWILKDISKKDEKTAIYTEVTSIDEWDAVAQIFQKKLDEENIQIII